MRVLLVEPSRYRSLLLRRALAARFPEAVLACFETTVEALAEMNKNQYNVVIAHFDSETLLTELHSGSIFEAGGENLVIGLYFGSPPAELMAGEVSLNVVPIEAASGFETEVMAEIEQFQYQTSGQVSLA